MAYIPRPERTEEDKKTVYFSENTNVLEQSVYEYQLQERETPNLYRNLFDYESVPKIAFNHRVVPMNTPKELWITDTTFRDGQQSTSPFTVKQIVDLYQMMHRLGGKKGLIRQSEFFVYTQKDREAVDKCLSLGYQFPEVTSWIRASENDFKLVKEIGLKETGILVSCSDYHIYNKMGLTRQQALDKYLGIVKSVLEYGIRPRCHFEDITRADFYGFVVPLARALHDLSVESGIPIKIRACDTMGYGVSFPGVALPRSVSGIVYGLMHYAQIPSDMLEWHGHNDFYKVVTNSTTAWLYGSSSVNCALLGIGERTGNCPLEAMVIEYCSLHGTTDGMNLPVITEIARYFEDEIGYEIPPRTPFVGRNFNVTRAGIHADGLLKDEEIYNIFNTQKLLHRPPTVSVDSHSGLAGIALWMNRFFRLEDGKSVDKKSELVAKVKEQVDLEYAEGRNTVMGDDELEQIIKRVDFVAYEKLIHAHLKEDILT
ncbi:MAG TPA: 2-isopropylmalate synthase [Oscillospiraceae bacterium]|nr:2-isopropylmalate synthase [Oscillospiraceae bacterium]HPS34766.1 2-isopropylmalate synthase [Oscillospiraceae bacterium]